MLGLLVDAPRRSTPGRPRGLATEHGTSAACHGLPADADARARVTTLLDSGERRLRSLLDRQLQRGPPSTTSGLAAGPGRPVDPGTWTRPPTWLRVPDERHAGPRRAQRRGRHHHRGRRGSPRHANGRAGGRGATPDHGRRSRARHRSRSRSRCARPGHEDELAIGFLVTEGLAPPGRHRAGDRWRTRRTASRPDDSVVVHLREPLDLGRIAERRTVATASCGICGTASIDDIVRRCDPLPVGPLIDRADPARAARPACGQRRRRSSRPVGCTPPGCSMATGSLVLVREDVGRHNALDKVIGASAAAGACRSTTRILLVSGRVSFELVQKAAHGGHPGAGRGRRPHRPRRRDRRRRSA